MASPSGRKSSRVVSGRSASPSASKMNAAPASRASARGGTPSGRGGDENRRSKVARPSKGGIPKEFIIAAVVVALLGVGTITAYTIQKGKKDTINRTLETRDATHNANVKVTYDNFMTAFNAGYKWVLGKPDAVNIKDDELFGPLKTDKVYNVVYSRSFKDKKGKDQSEEKVMYPSRNRIQQLKGGDKKDNVEMTRGRTEEEKFDVYIAVRNIPPEPGDNVNLGGSIRVIVKTEPEN